MYKILSAIYALKRDKGKEKIDVSGWKEYRLSDIFNYVSKGNTKNMNVSDGDYPFLSATMDNNGVFKCRARGNTLYDENTIVITDFGNVFYQKEKFYANSHVVILGNKFNLNKNIALFLKVIIEKEIKRTCIFGSNTFGEEKFYDTAIHLPTKNDQPDWEYMDQFIEDLRSKMML